MSGGTHRRCWLVLAHCFNMDGRAASQTITDKLPFVMARGVQPVVVSAPTGKKDATVAHYRVISPAPSGILFEGRHVIKRRARSRAGEKALKALLTIACLPFLIVEKLLVQMDSQWSWFLSAVPAGLWLVRAVRPEIIYTTAGPPSTHAAGYFLHRLTGLPWLAEVHDPLIRDNERPRWHHYRFKRWIEKRVFSHAAAVIYFTDKALADAAARHPPRAATYVLRPGAENPDLGQVSYRRRGSFHAAHFGSLADDRNLCGVIQAMAGIGAARPEIRDRLRLDVYGAVLDSRSERCRRIHDLDGLVCCHGRLEYDPVTGKTGRRQVLEAMRACDLLLIVHGSGEDLGDYVPSKLYEYLHARRPILGLADPSSELGRILTATGHRVVPADDAAAISAAMAKIIAAWETRGLPDMPKGSPYTVGAAVAQLFDIVDRLVPAPRPGAASPEESS